MSRLRLTTIFVSLLFLGIMIVVLCMSLPAHQNTSDYIGVGTSVTVVLALLYTGILVVPYYWRNSRYIRAIHWISFILCMIPVVIPLLLLILVSCMGGIC
ncbi:MAG TPA: hypothetical protein VLD19_05855 [Chitinophagaceae bacterium]|nr:hypothetical protein [Chitinophagaceae bacterium]